MREWYRFTNEVKEGDGAADLYVYDYIGATWDGEGVTAKKFMADVQALPKSVAQINLHVNSPGGSVFDAVAIANMLRAHRAAVNVSIEGLAASAATIVSMAGDKISIAENALFMIHDPYGFAMGGAKEMRAEADALDRVRDAIVATYKWHSPLDAEKISGLMQDVTWWSAQEAVDNGFATEVTGASTAQAHVAPFLGPLPARFAAALEGVAVKVAPPTIASAKPLVASSPPFATPKPANEGVEMTDQEIKAAIDAARTEGIEHGRTTERERIFGVEGALIPGHEKLIAELKRDPSVSPGDAALKVNAAERTAREAAGKGIRSDGKLTEHVAAEVSATGAAETAGELAARPIEEQAKHTWDRDADLRAEFEHMGGFDSYLEFRRAEASGVARILKAVK